MSDLNSLEVESRSEKSGALSELDWRKRLTPIEPNTCADDVTVIIPCAGPPDESLLPVTGKSSSAMVPLNGKPVIFWNLTYLIQLGYRKFVIAVRHEDSLLCSFVKNVFGPKAEISFCTPDKNGALGDTILCCAKFVTTNKALIVLGDTFFEFPDLDLASVGESFVLTHPVEDHSRWCLAQTAGDGIITRLIDKPTAPVTDDVKALIGVYGISQWSQFLLTLIEQSAKVQQTAKKTISLTDVLCSYNESQPLRTHEVSNWFDCGHADCLMQSRRRLLQQRTFNSLSYDEMNGTITKGSRNQEKFLDEIHYYMLLPGPLQIFFPRIINADTRLEMMSLTLEYYGYPTLAEVLLYESLDPLIWRQVFTHILRIVQTMSSYRIKADRRIFEKMYLLQVSERVEKLRSMNSDLRQLIEQKEVTLNDRALHGFPIIWPIIQNLVAKLASHPDVAVIHGDMCFSNILYDLNSRICKFIDPRGSFGEKGIYGDPRYDVAKLYHSLDGMYDYIVNDLFSVKKIGDGYQLEIYSTPSLSEIIAQFESVFFAHFPREEIKLIESLLFLSMGVFHYDNTARQQAFFLNAIRILNELLDSSTENIK
ncbi:MAG TPA: sugar phosphate nucleotidyltransferase [Oligoflexia bacterium]|nr:sugar phosphate nucleotidyltransferase [Oligoflexia bacterium]